MGLQKYFFNKQQFIEDYDTLKSSRKMAKKYGCTKNVILKYARSINYKCNYDYKLTPEKRQYIIDMYQQKTSKELAEELKLPRGEITKTWYDFNLKGKNRHIFKLDENFFEIIDTREKAYFLGLLAADGNVQYHKKKETTIKIVLQVKDEEILVKFKEVLKTAKTLQTRVRKLKNGEEKKYLSLEISSDIMGEHLAKYGIIPRKTWTYEPQNIPPALFSHFIRGYFDGDGGWVIQGPLKRACDYDIRISGFVHNLTKMQQLLQEHQIISRVYVDNREYASKGGAFGYLATINIEENKQFADFLYQDSEDLRLTRKFLTYQQFLNAYKNQRKKPKDAVSFEVNKVKGNDEREKKLED